MRQPGRLARTDRPTLSAAGAGEDLVRIRRTGVRDTSMHAFSCELPFFSYQRVLGNVLTVEVVAVEPDAVNPVVMARGTLKPYVNCRRCHPLASRDRVLPLHYRYH